MRRPGIQWCLRGELPSGDITLLTPTALLGGAADLTARTLGEVMEGDLGVSVIVENRPGGAGSVGMSIGRSGT